MVDFYEEVEFPTSEVGKMNLKQIYEYCKKELKDAKNAELLLVLLDFKLVQELAKRMNLTTGELTSFGGEWMLYEWNKILDEVEADADIRTLPEFDIAMKRLRKEKTTMFKTIMLEICLFTIRDVQVEKKEKKNEFEANIQILQKRT